MLWVKLAYKRANRNTPHVHATVTLSRWMGANAHALSVRARCQQTDREAASPQGTLLLKKYCVLLAKLGEPRIRIKSNMVVYFAQTRGNTSMANRKVPPAQSNQPINRRSAVMAATG